MLMLTLIRPLAAVIPWTLKLATWVLARSLCMPEPVVHDTGLFVFAQVQTFEHKVGKSLCPLRLLRRIRRDHVPDQLGCAGMGSGYDDGVGDAGDGPQGRFNLANFDPETANLDLRVGAAEILDVARGGPGADIAASVEASPRVRRMPARGQAPWPGWGSRVKLGRPSP